MKFHLMKLQRESVQHYDMTITLEYRKNSKSNEGRQEKNGGVKGRDGSAEELDRETGEEQGRKRTKDGR